MKIKLTPNYALHSDTYIQGKMFNDKNKTWKHMQQKFSHSFTVI